MDISHDSGIQVSSLLHDKNNVDGKNNYFPKNQLPLMAYKDFTWHSNPSSCTWTCEKTVAKHKYLESSNTDLEDMNTDGAVITGDGEFFGPYAYDEWSSLVAVYKDRGPGEFFHPVFKDVKYAILKKLEAKLEPRQNYVSYSFEFWEHTESDETLVRLDTPASPAPSTDIPATTAVVSTPKTYTVVDGDCLWNISREFCGDGTRYTEIARVNNIKNPDVISIGQVLTIPF